VGDAPIGKVRADRDRCLGSGTCVVLCPAVFDHDADGIVEILDERPPAEAWPKVMEAVAACPSEALSVDATDAP
jgi:ferredoxin